MGIRIDNGLWLFRDRVTLNATWGSKWDMSELKAVDAYTNKWRLGYRCLDVHIRVWRLLLGFTIWNMPFQRKGLNLYDND